MSQVSPFFAAYKLGGVQAMTVNTDFVWNTRTGDDITPPSNEFIRLPATNAFFQLEAHIYLTGFDAANQMQFFWVDNTNTPFGSPGAIQSAAIMRSVVDTTPVSPNPSAFLVIQGSTAGFTDVKLRCTVGAVNANAQDDATILIVRSYARGPLP